MKGLLDFLVRPKTTTITAPPLPLQRQVDKGIFWLRGEASEPQQSAWLVVGHYGNLLFHSMPQFEDHERLAKSIGGIWKQVLTDQARITPACGTIFSRFGASAVVHLPMERFRPELKVETLGESEELHFPRLVALPLTTPASSCWYLYDGPEKQMLFVGDEVTLSGETLRSETPVALSDEAKRHLADRDVDYVLGSRFVGADPFIELDGPGPQKALLAPFMD